MNNEQGSYPINSENVPKALLNHEKATLKLEQSHESNLKDKEYNHTKDLRKLEHDHEKDLKDKDLGLIGQCFGGKELVSLNISGILILSLLICGVTLSIIVYINGTIDEVMKIWGIITPLITLTLGYIFGSKDK